ncbi:hypothetical protein [Chryseobacterium sp. SIMBA_028]|uniref:hypothetical protein n=1 Tax=Chryseobacterium sp. SIMBA_028 TaxID=3085771 RepID=UPI00397952A4
MVKYVYGLETWQRQLEQLILLPIRITKDLYMNSNTNIMITTLNSLQAGFSCELIPKGTNQIMELA